MKSIILSLLLVTSVILGTSFATSPLFAACPATMPGGTVCLTFLEMAEIRQAQEMQSLEVADLRYEVARYKSLLKRSGKAFAQAGMEYLPNEDESIQPYLIGGWNFGRVTVWGGAFGDSPVIGLGWNF